PGLVLAHLWRSRTCSKLRQVLGGKQTWKCPPEWAAEEWLRARPHEALYLLCGEPPDLDQRAPPFQVPTHGHPTLSKNPPGNRRRGTSAKSALSCDGSVICRAMTGDTTDDQVQAGGDLRAREHGRANHRPAASGAHGVGRSGRPHHREGLARALAGPRSARTSSARCVQSLPRAPASSMVRGIESEGRRPRPRRLAVGEGAPRVGAARSLPKRQLAYACGGELAGRRDAYAAGRAGPGPVLGRFNPRSPRGGEQPQWLTT